VLNLDLSLGVLVHRPRADDLHADALAQPFELGDDLAVACSHSFRAWLRARSSRLVSFRLTRLDHTSTQGERQRETGSAGRCRPDRMM